MTLIERLVRRMGVLFGKTSSEDAMAEEMRFHLEMEERELMESGHSPEEARRLARVRFGGVERYKEEGREARGGQLLAEVVRDARFAVRGIRRRPGFAAAVIATVAIGVGATTAVWSVVDGALLRPLPYPAAEELVRVHVSWEGEPAGVLSPAEYLDFRRDAADVFEGLAAYATGSTTVGETATGGTAERVEAGFVAADLFPVLGTDPVLGRPFTESEELAGENVTVLSEGYWRQRFGGDPAILGSTVSLSGSPYTVVGVMPSSFQLPESMTGADRPSLFIPLGIHPDTTYNRGSHFLRSAARLQPGVDIADAASTVEVVAARFIADYPDDYSPESNFQFTAIPLQEALVGDARPALLAAMGAVLLVLLVGVANVAALLLARGDARRGEVALRTSLGAGRARLIRQLLVESLVLSLAGGALGAALAWVGVEAFLALDPAGVPRLDQIDVEGRVLAFAAGVSVVSGLLFGLLPALRLAQHGPAAAMREAATRTANRSSGRLRQLLVVGEIGFALTLLTGAGLLGRSLVELMDVDTGIRLDNVVATQFGVAGSRYVGAEAVRDFVATVVEGVAALPEVEHAGAVTNLPLATRIGDLGVEIPGRELPGDWNLGVDWQAATPGYDRAIGLPLLAGRWIEPGDRAGALGVVVINRTFAETWWPDGDAVGSTIRLTADAAPAEARVIGIVEDVTHEGPATAAGLQMYLPHRQFRFWHGGGPARGLTLVVRARPGAAVPPAVKQVFAEADPAIGLGPFLTLDNAYRDVLARPRILATLLAAFAVIALLLSAIGVYGVMAHSVERRRRELGIRAALGASSRTIAMDVITEGLRLAAIGIAVGIAGALLLSRSLRTLLFGVGDSDPVVLATGAVVLIITSLLASWAPARRALRADPAEALRAE